MKNVDTIAVLDFGGQYAHLIANRVRRLGVFTEIHSPAAPVSELEGVKGIIYSGGPSSVYAADAPEYNPEILNLPVPKLGICYGHQLSPSSWAVTWNRARSRNTALQTSSWAMKNARF